jgi:hypothetical protein
MAFSKRSLSLVMREAPIPAMKAEELVWADLENLLSGSPFSRQF